MSIPSLSSTHSQGFSTCPEQVPASECPIFSLFLLSLQVVILSQNCRNISESEAPSHILGYSLSNDVSARRDMFAVPQWGLGKSFDNWFPMGPCIVSPKMLGDPENVQLRTVLNGKEMQNDSTKKHLWKIYETISRLSQGTTLERGSVISM